jgi:hypothetical protein
MSTFWRSDYGQVRATIYTWEDGSRVDLRWWSGPKEGGDRRSFLFIAPNEDQKAVADFNPAMSPEERMFHIHVSDEWRSKIAGFFLDLGGKQDFAFSPEVSAHDSPYPIWMSDEDWGRRVIFLAEGRLIESDSEDSGHLVLVTSLAESQILRGEWRIYIMGPKDWRFVSGHPRNYTKQVPNKTGEYGRPIVIRAQSAQRLVDKICDMFYILPESKREWWERTQVERGTFVIPSPEEVEVFRILEEELPLLWPHETFVPWIEAQEPR